MMSEVLKDSEYTFLHFENASGYYDWLDKKMRKGVTYE